MAFRLRAVVALIAASFVTSSAAAYCRTHTGDPGQSSCPPVCPNLGTPLAWRSAAINYGFNERGFPGISDAQLRATFAASFKTWEDVVCEGERIGFELSALPGTTKLEQGPQEQEPNENVIVHYDAAAWAELDYSPMAFAITAVWFSSKGKTVGQIFGADMNFNGGMDLYGDCAVDQCTNSGLKTDLQNVATHEIGHFLGLSHSDVTRSTMSCQAQAQDTDKRTLEADDIAGICASYPPTTSFASDRVSGGGGRCSVAAVPAAGGLHIAALLGVAAVFGLRRRKRS